MKEPTRSPHAGPERTPGKEPRSGQRCTAQKPDGTPCRAWAKRDSDPPRCVMHPAEAPPAPPTVQPAEAQTPGQACFPEMSSMMAVESPTSPPPETIEQIIGDLAAKQASLSKYIDTCMKGGAHLHGLVQLFAIHGQNASRLGRLLRDQRALSGEASDGIAGAIAQALDELSTELGVEL